MDEFIDNNIYYNGLDFMKDYKKQFLEQLGSFYSFRELESMWRIFQDDSQIFDTFKSNSLLKADWESYFKDVIVRLINFEPIQYILGKAYFYDRILNVNNHVLIPRPETEELVHLIIQSHQQPNLEVLDIGTGTGCIPIILSHHMNQSKCTAWDVSEDALEIAKRNAEESKVDITFEKKNILTYKNDERIWDVIVSNPPYIPKSEISVMDQSTIEYEPNLALYVEDNDPLLFYRIITRFAYQHLKDEGYLYFECNEFNAIEVGKLINESNFKRVIIKKDLQGKDRMIKAIKS